jgi:4-carboxymuconolactone decarboxylase
VARISTITRRDQLPADAASRFDEIAGSRGRVAGPFSVLLHSPEIAGRAAHLGAYIRFESVLPARDRELAVLAVASEMECAYEWKAHAEIARGAGVDDATIAAAEARSPLERFGERDAMVVGFARELIATHFVSDSTFKAALARYGERGVVELASTVGYYAMIGCVLNACEVLP